MFNKGLGNIYKQAQEMQKKMAQVQEELKNTKIKCVLNQLKRS